MDFKAFELDLFLFSKNYDVSNKFVISAYIIFA